RSYLARPARRPMPSCSTTERAHPDSASARALAAYRRCLDLNPHSGRRGRSELISPRWPHKCRLGWCASEKVMSTSTAAVLSDRARQDGETATSLFCMTKKDYEVCRVKLNLSVCFSS